MAEAPEGTWGRVDPDLLSVGDRVRSITQGHSPHWQSDGIVTEIVRDEEHAHGRGHLTLRDAKGYSRHFWLRSMADWHRLPPP